MSFTKRDVKDRVVQHPRRYRLTQVEPNIFDFEPVPGTITESGTPINKAYLQPIEDGLNDALEKTGDGKDITVTFIEATTEADIASGEKLSIMFGKILKKFKNIISGTTAVGKALVCTGNAATATKLQTARTINNVTFDGTANISVADSTKAPTNHASTANSYGIGTAANYGHVKTVNDLTQASHVDGTALSAYQGKVLKDIVQAEVPVLLADFNLSTSARTDIKNYISTGYDTYIFKVTATNFIVSTTATSGTKGVSLGLFASGANVSSGISGSSGIVMNLDIDTANTPKSVVVNEVNSFVFTKGTSYKRNDSYYNYSLYSALLSGGNSIYFSTRFDSPAYCGLYLESGVSASGTINVKIYGQNIWR